MGGIGYMLAEGDVGLDLDGCRNPHNGQLQPWAADIIGKWDTYAEVSPSGCGVKLLGVASAPAEWIRKRGNKTGMVAKPKLPHYGDKCEVALWADAGDGTRFFTVTGHKLPEAPSEPQDCTSGAEWTYHAYFNGSSLQALQSLERPVSQRTETGHVTATGFSLAEVLLRDEIHTCRTAQLGSRSDADFAFCCAAAELGLDAAAAWKLASDAGKFAERGRGYFDSTWQKAVAKAGQAQAAGNELDDILISATEHDSTPPQWLWENWLPRRHPVMLAGAPSAGKTWLACYIAAALTNPRVLMWPDGSPCSTCDVVYVSADGDGFELKKRIEACGGDLERVWMMNVDDEYNVLKVYAGRLAASIRRRPSIGLLVLDTLGACAGGADFNDYGQAYPIMNQLRKLAAEADVGLLLLHHTRKSSSQGADIHAGLGSVGFVGAVRQKWLMHWSGGEQPRTLKLAKNNWGPDGGQLAYHIEDGRLQWGAEPDGGRAAVAGGERAAVRAAKDWLVDYLGDFQPHDGGRVVADGVQAGHSKTAIYEAAKSLGLTGGRGGRQDQPRQWQWT